jgi:group I intron endonuclease
MVIYKIINPQNKIYIGQTINYRDRMYQYRSSFKNKSKTHVGPKLYNSFQKYSWDEHTFEIIEECTLEQLNERETYWKKYYLEQVENDWSKVLFCELYDNGGGPKSEETKKKISQSNLKKIISDDTRLKKRNSMLGKKASEETKMKMSLAHRGKPKSEEHKKNMLQNRDNVIQGVKLKNSKPVLQYDLEMNLIKKWRNITEAKIYMNGKDISRCLYNKKDNVGGYIWKFA